jgi:hypothetical protein
MKKKGILTKAMVVAGTVLVWFPILVAILISIAGFIQSRKFHFDYLMPAEFFWVALFGAGLLLGAALWTHSRRAPIGWGLGAIVVLLGGCLAFAELTGLASGRIQPEGWVWGVTVTLLVLYSLSLIELGVAGVLLWRDLFRREV